MTAQVVASGRYWPPGRKENPPPGRLLFKMSPIAFFISIHPFIMPVKGHFVQV
jgi:hypothetical protein